MRPDLNFIRRIAINFSKVVATPAAPFALNFVSSGAIPFPALQPTQAAKIVSIVGTIFDPANTGNVNFNNVSINLIFTNPTGSQLLIAQAIEYGSDPGIVGGHGLRISAFDLPVLMGTDFADIATSIGGSPGQFLLEMGGDLGMGAPPGAVNLTFNLSALVELYQLRTNSP